jgi:hypothetical protein
MVSSLSGGKGPWFQVSLEGKGQGFELSGRRGERKMVKFKNKLKMRGLCRQPLKCSKPFHPLFSQSQGIFITLRSPSSSIYQKNFPLLFSQCTETIPMPPSPFSIIATNCMHRHYTQVFAMVPITPFGLFPIRYFIGEKVPKLKYRPGGGIPPVWH